MLIDIEPGLDEGPQSGALGLHKVGAHSDARLLLKNIDTQLDCKEPIHQLEAEAGALLGLPVRQRVPPLPGELPGERAGPCEHLQLHRPHLEDPHLSVLGPPGCPRPHYCLLLLLDVQPDEEGHAEFAHDDRYAAEAPAAEEGPDED